MRMEYRVGVLALLAFSGGVAYAQQSNIQCVVGEGGVLIATAPWRNTIGQSRADEICRNLAVSPSTEVAPSVDPLPAATTTRANKGGIAVDDADFQALPSPSSATKGAFAVETWQVRSGDLLSQTLKDWSAKAGWALVWDFPEKDDFRLGASNVFHADFKSAIYSLINSLPASVRIQVNLHQENSPPLIHVMSEEGGR